jgi:hypothetical protein
MLEVDHIVAWDLWQSKLSTAPPLSEPGGAPSEGPDTDDLATRCNEIGNCMLLEKNFNISKSNKSLKEFLEGVHEFKEGELLIDDWGRALDLEMAQVDSADTPVETLDDLFINRSQKIRDDLEQFIRGTKSRIDLPTSWNRHLKAIYRPFLLTVYCTTLRVNGRGSLE